MENDNNHIEKIRTLFAEMHTRRCLLELLNVAKPYVYGPNATDFHMKQLTWYAFKTEGRRYTEFTVKKKSGGVRTISAPVQGLLAIQKTLAYILQCVFDAHPSAYGFVKGRSIVDNARIHQKSIYVYNIDLKDFFPSIDQARVWKCLQLKPFGLTDRNEGIYYSTQALETNDSRLGLANVISALCCTEMEVERVNHEGIWEKTFRKVLPQGAPTSPVLTNVVCQRLDYLLTAVAKRFGLKYTRYADDITFSSMHNVYQEGSLFLTELARIIKDQGFSFNEKKTRLQLQKCRQEVTGLLVNEIVNVKRNYVKELRMHLYYWEQYGYNKAYGFFLIKYKADKGHIKGGKPDMQAVLRGKLDYLMMVKGEDNALYISLRKRFDALSGKQSIIGRVLQEWEANGIESAMELYYTGHAKLNPRFDKNLQSEYTQLSEIFNTVVL